jgi:p-hydroxybenzoate 3-monooxygenase
MDLAALAPALATMLRKNDTTLADSYSDTALRRAWRYTHFSMVDDHHAAHQR